MSYHIQQMTLDGDSWETLENSGDDINVMKAAVDELIVAADKGNTGHAYRLVDDSQQVVYEPTDEEVGFPADEDEHS